MIDDFPVRPRDIEIEPVCCLALNVAKERLAVTSCLHHVTHRVPPEERVELSHRAIQSLRRCPAREVNL